MGSQINVEIRFVWTILAGESFVKNTIFAHLHLHVQSRKFARNRLIINYTFCKLFNTALNTTYAEPKWKATYPAELESRKLYRISKIK